MSKIRRAVTERDLESVRHMDRVIFPYDEKIELDGAVWWLVEDDDGAVVGFGGVSIGPPYAFVSQAYLRRAGLLSRVAGRGLHRRLIRVRLAYARAQGATHAVTYTVSDGLKSANNLIACGFRLYTPWQAWAGKGPLYFRLVLGADG